MINYGCIDGNVTAYCYIFGQPIENPTIFFFIQILIGCYIILGVNYFQRNYCRGIDCPHNNWLLPRAFFWPLAMIYDLFRKER